MSDGVTFFNFGGGCVVRLLVALDSLRRHSPEVKVTVFLKKDDPFNAKIAPVLDEVFYADPVWFDLEEMVKRNLKCVLKPQLFRRSPYINTLMCDGDLLFQAPIEPLFELLRPKGFLVTQFSTWNADGPKMTARLSRAKPFMSPEQWKLVSGKFPAINIGVMGWSSGNPLITPWEEMTRKLSGIHMADETAAQAVYPTGPHVVAPSTWNESCLYSTMPPEKAAVLHFHGNKATSLTRPSSRRWIAAFRGLLFSGKVPGFSEFLTWDDASLQGLLQSNPEILNPNLKFTP